MRTSIDHPWQEEIAKHVRVPQIIIGALIAGLLMFAAVIAATQMGGQQVEVPDHAEGEPPKNPDAEVADVEMIFIAIGLAMGTLALLLHRAIAGMAVAKGRRAIQSGQWTMPRGFQAMEETVSKTGDAGKLFVLFQTRTIVAGAILEGAAFFNLIAYLLTSQPLLLGMAGVMILGLIFLFPTRSRVVCWIEDQLRYLEETSMLAR